MSDTLTQLRKMLPRSATGVEHPDVGSQKRQFPRYALEAAMTLTTAEGILEGRTANLSRGGLSAVIPAPVAAGQRVTVELALVFENETYSETLTLQARVVWCTAMEGGYQLGLSFAPVRPESIQYLEMFLKFLAEGRRLKAVVGESSHPFD
jgi:hypothetical protein